MGPVQQDIRSDEEDHHLNRERQLGERPVAVVVERDQTVRGGDAEHQRRTHDQ